MGPIGVQEMIAIFVIALVLFGPKKLPELGRILGKGLSEFRRAKNELKNTFETHMHELERETRLQDSSSSAPPDCSSSRYSYPYEDYSPYDSENSSAIAPSNGSQEAESSNSSATVPQIEAPRDELPYQNTAIADTVPRVNGVPLPEPSSVASEEQHRV